MKNAFISTIESKYGEIQRASFSTALSFKFQQTTTVSRELKNSLLKVKLILDYISLRIQNIYWVIEIGISRNVGVYDDT